MNLITATIEKTIELDIWVEAQLQSEEDKHTLDNGDPGYPGYSELVIIDWGLIDESGKYTDKQPNHITDAMVYNIAEEYFGR